MKDAQFLVLIGTLYLLIAAIYSTTNNSWLNIIFNIGAAIMFLLTIFISRNG